MLDIVVIAVVILLGLGLVIMLPVLTLGLVIIGEQQVGIVVKKFSLRGEELAPGKLIALNGEPGYQADTLAPGWYLGYWPWMYSVEKVPAIVIPQGEIGLVVAASGAQIPAQRILGRVVKCDDYQNAREFLMNGGEKGRQLGILTAGTYRINTALFRVITASTATKHGMNPEQLYVYAVQPDKVGIVTTLDGAPIAEGEIAGLYLPGHNNFQNAQTFLNRGGQRGLQEQVLLSGTWNLNPWFVHIEQVPMTEVPIGYVGVVISYIGKAHQDVSGMEFKHGDLVNMGHKGVWASPLYPGKHPINVRVMKVELVPTINIVLNWAKRIEEHHYDRRLSSVTVRSKDGFAFDLDVSQIIHVGALEAPKVVSRVGSVQNLVDHVLEPIVGNYFRNAAQEYTVLDFLIARSERQVEAAQHIRRALVTYDVEAVDTLIGDINPPEDLMVTLTDRKIAEEQRKTYQVQQDAQTQRQELVRETAIADIQEEIVKAERGVNIAELEAKAQVRRATGEAESISLKAKGEAKGIRMKGESQAYAYQAGAAAMGQQGFTALQLMKVVGDNKVRIIPDINVSGGGSGETGDGMVNALLSMVLQNQLNEQNGNKEKGVFIPTDAPNGK